MHKIHPKTTGCPQQPTISQKKDKGTGIQYYAFCAFSASVCVDIRLYMCTSSTHNLDAFSWVYTTHLDTYFTIYFPFHSSYFCFSCIKKRYFFLIPKFYYYFVLYTSLCTSTTWHEIHCTFTARLHVTNNHILLQRYNINLYVFSYTKIVPVHCPYIYKRYMWKKPLSKK